MRTADEPGQSVNVNLCYIPAIHETAVKLPAVSGSSGKLVVAGRDVAAVENWYPGQVFAEEELSYKVAMAQFVADIDVQKKIWNLSIHYPVLVDDNTDK